MRGWVLLLVCGCGQPFDNVTACEEANERVEAVYLECSEPNPLVSTAFCDPALIEEDEDCKAFYDCWASSYTCEEGQVKTTSENCVPCGFGA